MPALQVSWQDAGLDQQGGLMLQRAVAAAVEIAWVQDTAGSGCGR